MDDMSLSHLTQDQQKALDKLIPLLGSEGVEHLASQGSDAVNARLEMFYKYENTLLERLQWTMPSPAPPPVSTMAQEAVFRPKPLMVSVKTFESKEEENLLLWIREIKMAMELTMLSNEPQCVALAISKLEGRAREWALTCGTSTNAAFPTWGELRLQLSRVFAPPNQAYRTRSRFLASRQGKRKLGDFVQESRTLIAGMAVDPLPKIVTATVFMEGLRAGVARTEVFRARPSSFEEAVDVAWNAEINFKSARLGWGVSHAHPSDGARPMDLSYAEDEEAELQAAEQHMGVRKCFICKSTTHIRDNCPSRKLRSASRSQRSASQTSGLPRGNGATQ